MKALVYRGPRDLRLEELPEPEPQDGEALVAIEACCICGSDLHGYLGHSRARVPPLVLGHEIGGRVLDVGPGADRTLVGAVVAVRPTIVCGECRFCREGRDNVCERRLLLGLNIDGGLAERVVVPVSNLVPLEHGSAADAALVEVLANAVHVLALAGEPRSIGVAGGGGLGAFIIALASLQNIPERLLTEPLHERRSIAASLGATRAAEPPLSSLAEQLPGGALDAAVDAVGLEATRRDCVSAVRNCGRVVLLGLEHEESELDFADVIRRQVELVGSFGYTAKEFREAATLLPKLIDALGPLVESEPLERGADVFAALADRSDSRLKVALLP